MRRTRVAPDGLAPSLTQRGRAMQQDSAVFVGLDTSKMKISVALAEEGRQGEVRFLGDIDHTPETVRRLVTKLAGKYGRLLFHRYTTAHRSPCRRRAERRAPGEPSGRAGSHTSRGGSPARRLPPAPSLQRVAPPCLRRSGCRAAVACRPLSGCRPGAPAERDSGPTGCGPGGPTDWPRGSLRSPPPSRRRCQGHHPCASAGRSPSSSPAQVDDMVQRAERHSGSCPRQIGYPLSVRGQVRRAQGPLPCVAATVLCSWRLPSLGRVPMSSVPRRRRYYEGATTSHPASRLLLVRDRVPRGPPRFVLAEALPGGWRSRPSLGRLVRRRPGSGWRPRGRGGISQVPRRSIPCLCPAPRPRPNQWSLTKAVPPMLPPRPTRRRLQRSHDLEAATGLRHPLPTLRMRRCRRLRKARFRLAGWPLPGGGRTLRIATKGFRTFSRRPPFQGLPCRKLGARAS